MASNAAKKHFGKGHGSLGDSCFSDLSKLTLEEDKSSDVHKALPWLGKPAPTQLAYQTLTQPLDPDLCITPEKSAAFKASHRADAHSSADFRGSRSSLKVHFDDVVDVQQYSAVDDSAQETEESGSPDYGQGACAADYDHNIQVEKYSYRVEEDVEVKPQNEAIYCSKTSPPPSVDVRRKLKNKTDNTVETVKASHPIPTYAEHVLARPEFNSTLRNMKQIHEVRMSELDVAAALKKEIEHSDKTQKQVAEKASAKVDVKESQQFVDLVEVNVPEVEVISFVMRERAAQVKPTRKPKSRPEDYITNPQDIMDFFTDDLQKEYPSWDLPGVKLPQPKLRGTDSIQAYDLYKHIHHGE